VSYLAVLVYKSPATEAIGSSKPVSAGVPLFQMGVGTEVFVG
jgi:hypothetical protein